MLLQTMKETEEEENAFPEAVKLLNCPNHKQLV